MDYAKMSVGELARRVFRGDKALDELPGARRAAVSLEVTKLEEAEVARVKKEEAKAKKAKAKKG